MRILPILMAICMAFTAMAQTGPEPNDLFREVVGNGMVGFYEHAMAQQLLRR